MRMRGTSVLNRAHSLKQTAAISFRPSLNLHTTTIVGRIAVRMCSDRFIACRWPAPSALLRHASACSSISVATRAPARRLPELCAGMRSSFCIRYRIRLTGKATFKTVIAPDGIWARLTAKPRHAVPRILVPAYSGNASPRGPTGMTFVSCFGSEKFSTVSHLHTVAHGCEFFSTQTPWWSKLLYSENTAPLFPFQIRPKRGFRS